MMNAKIHAISLAVGGSFYPTVNSELQQKFGETIVLQILDRIVQTQNSVRDPAVRTVLDQLCDQITKDFDIDHHEKV